VINIPMDKRVQSEAMRWFARMLAPDCAPAERTAFERWRCAHPDHAAAYGRVEQLMGRVPELHGDPAILQASREALHGSPARPVWRRAGLAVAASVALIAVGMAVSYFHKQTPADVRYATTVGEQRSVQLADGTTIRLDTDTQLEVSYTPGKRQVDLLRGRAQYNVAHDTARPFVVTTLGGTVTAVGTEFQTGIQNNAVTVILLEGKVAVADSTGSGPRSTLLQPGEQLTYNANGTIWSKATADMEAANGWTMGKLVFKDAPLPELVREVNRYSSAKLRITDPSLNTLHITGSFKADDQESLLLALQGIWSIRADPQPSGEILLSRKR
jgi:transmembrane sensor